MVIYPTKHGRLPSRYVKIEFTRRPFTSYTGPDRAPTGCSRHVSWLNLMKKCITRHPTGAFPANLRFVPSIHLVKLSTRVHSLNEEFNNGLKIERFRRYRISLILRSCWVPLTMNQGRRCTCQRG